MENVLNRRMFQQPIHAKSGVYVPTIEDILQFYQGEFNANGEPIDQEALMRAADIATIAGAAANKDNSQFLLDDEMAEKYKALGANIIPDGRGAQMFGTDVQAGDTRSDDGWNIDDLPLNAEELLQQEKAKVLGGPDLKIHDYDNMPADLQEKVEAMDKSENDYAQEQLLMDKLNNQRQLELIGANNAATVARDLEKEINYQNLQKERENREEFAKVRNLAGDREQDVSEDENIEIIKRNILQGTNIIEPGTEEFRNLSAVDRMKVKNAITEKRKEEVDLTDVSEKGLQNIIDAAGESAEVAIEIWNDMKNFGGEVAEGADEMLTGWKDAISSGWSDEQKKDLTDQINLLKTKGVVTSRAPDNITSLRRDLEDQAGGKEANTLKGFLKRITGNTKDFIFGSGLGDAEIEKGSPELLFSELQELIQPGAKQSTVEEDKLTTEEEYLKASGAGDSVDTTIFKEETEDKETIFGKIVTDLNEQMDKLLSDRDNNIIDGDTFKEAMNTINDKKNDLLEKFNETDTKKWLDKKGEDLIDYRKQALEDGADSNEDGKVGPIELFEYHLKQKQKAQESEDRIKGSMIGSSPADAIERAKEAAKKKNAEKIVEESKVIVTEGEDGVATIDDTEEAIVTTDEVIGSDNAINKADIATVTPDTVGLAAASEAVPAGTSAMAKLIAETAKETGYNFGSMDQTKDDLALKTIMYGLKLATTPGKFSDAVLATGFDAVKNEINERYRTKASKQKFAGTLFNTMLAGKLDIEKERVKAANKKTVQKKYDFGKNFQASTLARIQTGDPKKGLGFDLSGLGLDDEMNEDNAGAKMFVLDIMDEMQMLANRKVTGGDEVNPDELFNQAVENLSPVYKIVTKDLFGIMSFLDKNVWLPGDWDAPKETTIERLRTDTRPGLTSTVSTISAAERKKILEQFKDYPVTEKNVKQQMKEHNKTRDEVIAEFEKLGADISGV